MGSLARHARPGLLLALLTLASAPTGAAANEVGAAVSVSGVRIHGPEEVMRDFCSSEENGSLWIKLPGAGSYELVTATSDAAIANPGDGSFHPFDEQQVRAALSEVRYPLAGLNVDIYLLPYPRRGGLDSGAGPGVILLSPGVAPISREQQHAEFVHELGHVVQYQWMPDGDGRWNDYRLRRGLGNASRYSAGSIHADRPHEIFAEDFRALFGGALATYSGSIENPSLAHPAAIPGLDAFMRSLPEGAPVATRPVAGSNPARGPVAFSLAVATDQPLDLFDVIGRRIATVTPVAAGGRTLWRWDGRDSAGRPAERGVLLARVRGSSTAAARVSWLP